MKKLKYQINLFSEMLGKYAPSVHPTFDTPREAATFARQTLKMEENLSGKTAFKVEPVAV